jgi:plastocyanin domain-containing protein
VQKVSIRALNTGFYDNRVVTVKAGMPVELSFSADANAGCGRAFYLDEYHVQLVAQGNGVQTATFTPTKVGTFDYHCGMWMFRGKLIVQ